MSATSALDAMKAKFEEFGHDIESELSEHLPEVEKAVTAAESNPVVSALASATHLTAVPEILQAVASVVNVLDAAVGAAKQVPASDPGSDAVQAPAAPVTPAPAAKPAH